CNGKNTCSVLKISATASFAVSRDCAMPSVSTGDGKTAKLTVLSAETNILINSPCLDTKNSKDQFFVLFYFTAFCMWSLAKTVPTVELWWRQHDFFLTSKLLEGFYAKTSFACFWTQNPGKC